MGEGEDAVLGSSIMGQGEDAMLGSNIYIPYSAWAP